MNRLFLLLFGMVTFVAHAQVPDYVPTEGLVAWYPFNGNANDESGNAQDGEIVGAQLTDDRFGSSESAYSFDHTRIEIENSAANDQFKTISFWFMSNSPAGNQVAFKQNVYIGHGYERVSCAIQWSGTHFAGKEVCNAGWQYDNVGGELNDGIWHHYVGILDAAQKRLYIDGTLLDESEFNPENMCSGGDLIIGQEWDGVPYDFIGDLDDFGFWNRALTESEILALYNAPPPAPGCTDPTACNYDEEATSDDGSCTYPPFGLTDCEAGGALCGEGTVWDASLQACVGFDDCPSDVDGDGIIGVNDLLSLLADFGTECPPEVVWACGDPVNYHGYNYATVQIGEQCWFAENLRTAQYSNGDEVPNLSQGADWQAATNDGSGAWAYFSNDPESGETFGKLYNWYVTVDERGICPIGWHVPENAEWGVLVNHYGGSETAAIELKGDYSEDWYGNGSSGFNALPGGFRDWGNSVFFFQGTSGDWWTSSEQGSGFWIGMDANSDNVHNALYGRAMGNSIRCLKDQ